MADGNTIHSKMSQTTSGPIDMSIEGLVGVVAIEGSTSILAVEGVSNEFGVSNSTDLDCLVDGEGATTEVAVEGATNEFGVSISTDPDSLVDGEGENTEIDGMKSYMDLSSNKSKFWVPIVDEDCKPYIGMQFTSLEDGISFYDKYARASGFEWRHSTLHTDNGCVIRKWLICNREGKKNSKNSTGKRKRQSNRCYCKARIALKYCGGGKYNVTSFIEEHTHPFLSSNARVFAKSNRTIHVGHQTLMAKCRRVKMGATKTYRLFKELCGGYANVGAIDTDFKNSRRDLMAYIKGADAQMVIDRLFQKKDVCSAFYFDYEVDEFDQLTKIIWVDPIGRMNYSIYGDVVSFDATYSSNKYNMVFAPFTGLDNHNRCVTFGAGLLLKEDVASYAWLFEKFKTVMGKEPAVFITDQDPAMKIAFNQVFETARQRLCMWHIMEKVPGKVGAKYLVDHPDFLKAINALVWRYDLEVDELELKWAELIDEFNPNNRAWFDLMFELRDMWLPPYFRDVMLGGLVRTTSISESTNGFFDCFTDPHPSLVEVMMHFECSMEQQRHEHDKLNSVSETMLPDLKTELEIEKHCAEVYTVKQFYKIQQEITAACFSCRVININEDDSGVHVFTIKDVNDRIVKVEHRISDNHCVCTCKLFMRIGIPCSHIFLVYKDIRLSTLPCTMVLSRWTKFPQLADPSPADAELFRASLELEESKLVMNNLWGDFYSCIGMVSDNCELLSDFARIIRDQKVRLEVASSTKRTTSNKKVGMVESFIGAKIPSNISVLPPEQAKNKGSGRWQSGKEKKIQKTIKGRTCSICNKRDGHNSRTCPNR